MEKEISGARRKMSLDAKEGGKEERIFVEKKISAEESLLIHDSCAIKSSLVHTYIPIYIFYYISGFNLFPIRKECINR